LATAVRSAHRSSYDFRDSISGSTRGQSIAQGLGWFSLGLGLAQVVAPRAVARFIGINDGDRSAAVMRAIGMREIASGLGIFSQRNDAAFLWGRVVGDAMDLALLATAMGDERNDRGRLLGATAAVVGALVADVGAARTRSNPEKTSMAEFVNEWPGDVHDLDADAEHEGKQTVRRAITINRPPEEVGQRLQQVAQDTQFLKHLESTDVSLRPGPRGGDTEVHVQIAYEPRGGKIGETISKMRRKDPGQQVMEELRHLKQVVEIGEIVHSDASIHRGMHPARPDEEVNV